MKLTMITAVFNNHRTVGDALNSLFEQTYPDIESIIIDGGSTDGTLGILKSYESRFQVLVSEPDRGIYDALNKGIQLATGDVIGVLHSDDLLADPETLSNVAIAFSDPNVDGVYGDLIYVSKDNCERVVRYWEAGAFSQSKLAWGWMPPHPALFLRKEVYERFGLFDTRYRIAADYDFILRVLGSGIRVAYLPKVLVKMRVGGASNRSLTNLMRKTCEDYQALRRNRIGGPGSLVWKNLGKLSQFVRR